MKIGVLLSGGVDSAVSAALLKRSGHEVVAVTMINWNPDSAPKAAQIADFLEVEHHIADLREAFQTEVVDYFCNTYLAGSTPNPCIRCNEFIKFGLLLQYALQLGCDKVASGHYAQIRRDARSGLYSLHQGLDSGKDQSYFLYRLNQQQLQRILFPLGEMTKEAVWELAAELKIPVTHGQESQEICFIEGDYRNLLTQRARCQPGEIVDTAGRVIGRHRGLPFYTVGQRRGLGIAAAHPLYIVDMRTDSNHIIAGGEKDLYQSSLYAGQVHFISGQEPESPHRVQAKIRYRAALSEAVLYPHFDRVKVDFAEPQRAITKGQSVVFYLGDQVLGGGIIEGIGSPVE